ncbi:MAG TPA: tetratricopeptide repeat protein [Vicinamibacterales bacterium]|nr:tetratricopeptide repeat protein [Vicinamibacterales bacterium]
MALAALDARSAARRLVRRAGPAAVAAAVPLLIFGRAVKFGYVQADDTDLVRDNQPALSAPGIFREAFSRSYFEAGGRPDTTRTYYRPLVIVSLALDASAAGADPAVYHATTVLLHAVVVSLLFAALRTLGASATTAVMLAAVFGVHPAAVPVACWILGRNDSLLAAFVLGSLLAFERWRRRNSRPALAGHLGLFAAALFTKETAVVFAPLALLRTYLAAERESGGISGEAAANSGRSPSHRAGVVTTGRRRAAARDRLPDARAQRANTRERLSRIGQLVAGYAPIVLIWFVLRHRALPGGAGHEEAPPVTGTVLANLPDLLVYLSTAVFPVRPSVMPGPDRLHGGLGVAGGLLLVWIVGRARDRRLASFGAAWFAAFLAPALLVPGLPAYAHRLYVPLIGLAFALAALHDARDAAARWRWRAVLATATVLFAAISFVHSGAYRDRRAYWASATRGTPHAPIAHVNLGRIYEEEGDAARAAAHYHAALALDPVVPGARNNLGVLAARAGRLAEAQAYFEQEIALYPANADAHFNLGLVHQRAGRLEEAAASWERAIAVDPAYAPAYDELAAHYARKGDRDRAEAFATRAAALRGR